MLDEQEWLRLHESCVRVWGVGMVKVCAGGVSVLILATGWCIVGQALGHADEPRHSDLTTTAVYAKHQVRGMRGRLQH